MAAVNNVVCPSLVSREYAYVWVVMTIGALIGILLSVYIAVPIDCISQQLNQLALMDLQNVKFDPISHHLWELRKIKYNFKHLVSNLKLYNVIRVSILVLDEHMKVTFANPFFFSSFNIKNQYQADQWIAHLLETDGDFADNILAIRTSFYESIVKEVHYEGPNGTVYLKIHGRINDADNVILAIENITEQLRYEVTLQEAIQQAENANRATSQFLSHMTHELRTPLNGVIGITSLIADMDLTSEQQVLVDSIKFSADLLVSLISDILDLAKIEAGAVEIINTPLDIQLLCENIIATTSQSIKKEIEIIAFIDPKIPCCVIGDPRRISQILNNLLSNACKFTDDGHVFLAVEFRGLVNGSVQLTVLCEDTGIGVKSEDQGGLFEAFYQSNPYGPNGGTGLGLSITAALVKMMDSPGLKIKSEWGQGSTFYFDMTLEIDKSEEVGTKSYKEITHKLLGVADWPTRNFPIYATTTCNGNDQSNKGTTGETVEGQYCDDKIYNTVATQTDTLELISRPALRNEPIDTGDEKKASIELAMPFDDTPVDKGSQTTASDTLTNPQVINCAVIIDNRRLKETIYRYLPEGWLPIGYPSLSQGLNAILSQELAIYDNFQPTNHTPTLPDYCVIIDSLLLFNPYEKRSNEFRTNQPAGLTGKVSYNEDERLAKEREAAVEMNECKRLIREISTINGKAREKQQIAHDTPRPGSSISTSTSIHWIMLINRRHTPDLNDWFDKYDKVILLPKPIRYADLMTCLASIYQKVKQLPVSQVPERSDIMSNDTGPIGIMVGKNKNYNRPTELAPCRQSSDLSVLRPMSQTRSANQEVFPARLHVLLVEDNLINIKVATTMLKTAQLSFDVAQNGKEAVDMVVAGDVWYDVILMDVQMPIMDGLQATAEIRKHERQQAEGSRDHGYHVIIAMTADVMSTTIDHCYGAGMDDYFPKPIRKQEFNRVLCRWSKKSYQINAKCRCHGRRDCPLLPLVDVVKSAESSNSLAATRLHSVSRDADKDWIHSPLKWREKESDIDDDKTSRDITISRQQQYPVPTSDVTAVPSDLAVTANEYPAESDSKASTTNNTNTNVPIGKREYVPNKKGDRLTEAKARQNARMISRRLANQARISGEQGVDK